MPPKKKVSRKKRGSSAGAKARSGQKKGAAAKSGSRDNERAYLDEDDSDYVEGTDGEGEQVLDAQVPDPDDEEDGDYVSEVEEAKPREKSVSGKTAGKFTANGRVAGRKLVPWHRPRMMEKLILCIQYECQLKDIKLPWSDVVQRLNPGSSGESVLQFLSKERDKLIVEGHFVPPMIGHQKKRVDTTIRGYIQDENYISPTDVRSLPWAEDHVHPKKSTTLPGVYHGSGSYKQNPKYKAGSSRSLHRIVKENTLHGRRDRRPKEPPVRPAARRRSGRNAPASEPTSNAAASSTSSTLKHGLSNSEEDDSPSSKKIKSVGSADTSHGTRPERSLVIKFKVPGQSTENATAPFTSTSLVASVNELSGGVVAPVTGTQGGASTPPATPANSTIFASAGAGSYGHLANVASKPRTVYPEVGTGDVVEHSPVVNTPIKDCPVSPTSLGLRTPVASSPFHPDAAYPFSHSSLGMEMEMGWGMGHDGLFYVPEFLPPPGLRVLAEELPRFQENMQREYAEAYHQGLGREFLIDNPHVITTQARNPYPFHQNPHTSHWVQQGRTVPTFTNPFAQASRASFNIQTPGLSDYSE